jgi:uncharacterized protein (TIGR03437 family)
MKFIHLAYVCLLCCAGSPLAAQPVINANGVLNAASYAGPLAQGASVQIAQGAIAVIFGKGLGPATLVQAGGFPLPLRLPATTGTSVQIAAGGSNYNGILLYSSAGQVAFIVPSAVPVGSATVTVNYGNANSNGIKVQIVKAAFGLFTKNAQGTGPVVAQNYVSPTSTPTNGLATAAQAGQVLILYGTGLGPIAGDETQPPGAVTVAAGVTITVGGVPLTPLYAGRSPNFPGLDQINVQLPSTFSQSAEPKSAAPGAGSSSTLAGCYVSMTVDITGATPSNQVTVSLAPPGQTNCVHPLGLDSATELALDNGGSTTIGLMEIVRFNLAYLGLPGLSVVDAAGGGFVRGTADSAFQISQNQGSPYPWIKPGQCIVVDPVGGTVQNSSSLQLPSAVPNFNPAQIVSAGTGWTLTGPGASMPLNKQANGGYATNGTNAFLTSGTWTISSSGGNTGAGEIGAFQIPITFGAGAPPTWTNAGTYDGKTVSTNQAITFNWTKFGDPNNPNFVGLQGASTLVNLDLLGGNTSIAAKTFNCVALSTDGTFTVPQSVVSQLPLAPAGTTPGIGITPTSGGGLYFGNLGFGTGDIAIMPKITNVSGGAIAWGFADARNVVWSK